MDPHAQFCHNSACPAVGQTGQGNITVHSQKERRYRCQVCERTFTERKGTALEGLKKDVALFAIVITLLSHGCPIPAIVAAYGLDVRTVRDWLHKAGAQCERVHRHFLGRQLLDLIHVQVDELKVKLQGGWLWLASAICVPTRLWLGGAVSARRDRALLAEVVAQIRTVARNQPLLLAVDGLHAYIAVFQEAFRSKWPRHGRRGRSQLVAWSGIVIVQVIKHLSAEHFHLERRVVQGSEAECQALLQASGGGQLINTAFIERLNATFRQCLGHLVRRSRHQARKVETLQPGMYLLGCVYNFCRFHQSLRLPLWITERRRKWVPRTPAIATGWTDHRWDMLELLTFKVPPPRWRPPYRQGRPPKALAELAAEWAT
jgi:transposase-like protein